MNRFLFFILLLLIPINMWSDNMIGQLELTNEITLDDFMIIDKNSKIEIYLYQPISDILKILGNPITKDIVKSSNEEWDYIKYYMESDITIGFFRNEFNTSLIKIYNDNFSTKRGISIGDSQDDIFFKYGQKELFMIKELSSISSKIIYFIEDKRSGHRGTLLYLSFLLENGIIKEISIYNT